MNLVLKIVLTALLIAGISESGFSQMQYSRKYRVIATKAGNSSVQSVSNEVEIVPPMSIYIPNTFTPNGDGMNDTFGVSGEAIKDFNLQVYNRWGQLIFETANANERWDGTYNGVKAPEGAYVYKVSAESAAGKHATREGNLNLIF